MMNLFLYYRYIYIILGKKVGELDTYSNFIAIIKVYYTMPIKLPLIYSAGILYYNIWHLAGWL